MRCWGANTYAQCGATAASVTSAAVTVTIADVAQVSAGTWHTCARTRRGAVSCWGRNNLGRLGQATLSPSTSRTPLTVALPSPAVDLSAGNAFQRALLESREVWCWGEAHVGQLGRPTAAWLRPGPVPLTPTP